MAESVPNYDIEIVQGATFRRSILWRDSDSNPLDLTGYTARMQIRKSVNATEVLHEMTSENGGITLGGAAGTLLLLIPAATSSAFTFKSGVYDLEIEDTDGVVKRLIEGSVTLSREVTR